MSYHDPWERVTECVLRYADAEDDADFRRARDALRKAAVAYGVAVMAGKDRHVTLRIETKTTAVERIYVVRRARIGCPSPAQLALWPVRVGNLPRAVPRLLSTG